MSRTSASESSSSNAVTHAVCPFCGTVVEIGAGPCRQCGMDNTQATRSATRSKIGPWFVWQSRNPSAPGMNWATLMALIERGRITPRSVLRGPTTGQLWRFAARVKGISREFGVCWHCGTQIEKAARVCHACKRLQQPPIFPDNLLESDPPASAPVERRVESPRTVAVQEGKPLPTAPAPAELLSMPMVEAASIPADMEMRAFSLGEEDGEYSEPRGRLGRKLLWAAVIAILCGVAAGGYSPQFRQIVQQKYRLLAAKVSGKNATMGEDAGPAQRVVTTVPSFPRESIAAVYRQAASQPASERVAALPETKPIAQISVGPGQTETHKSTIPPVAATQVFTPPLDPHLAESWAWERYERAIKYEQKQEYAQAAKDYEWIRDLRLPDGVGPSDVQTRLDRVNQLLRTAKENSPK